MILQVPEEPSSTFKILLIASEIIIPLIVFVGVYLIFKPVFGKDKKKESQIEEGEVNQSVGDDSKQ